MKEYLRQEYLRKYIQIEYPEQAELGFRGKNRKKEVILKLSYFLNVRTNHVFTEGENHSHLYLRDLPL